MERRIPILYKDMQRDKQLGYNRTHREKLRGEPIKQRKYLKYSSYRYMFEQQKGVCAICGGVDVSGRALAIDHDHKTGFVRGLLCGKCNRALGMFGDDMDILLKAVEYLKIYGNS